MQAGFRDYPRMIVTNVVWCPPAPRLRVAHVPYTLQLYTVLGGRRTVNGVYLARVSVAFLSRFGRTVLRDSIDLRWTI